MYLRHRIDQSEESRKPATSFPLLPGQISIDIVHVEDVGISIRHIVEQKMKIQFGREGRRPVERATEFQSAASLGGRTGESYQIPLGATIKADLAHVKAISWLHVQQRVFFLI